MKGSSLGGRASAIFLLLAGSSLLLLQRRTTILSEEAKTKQTRREGDTLSHIGVCAQERAQSRRGENRGEGKVVMEVGGGHLHPVQVNDKEKKHEKRLDEPGVTLVLLVPAVSTSKGGRETESTPRSPLNPTTPAGYKNPRPPTEKPSVAVSLHPINMEARSRIPRVQPIFVYKGDRDLSSPAADAARLRLDTQTRQFYDFFYEIYQRGRIVPTFRQTLTQEQSQYLIFVRQLSDWMDSDDSVAFQQEVDIYKFISFDLEQIKPNKAAVERVPLFKRRRTDQDRCVYAIFGTITGRVVIFDLESCFGGPVMPDDPLVTVPPEFVAWIKSPDVIVAGSGVDRDLEEAGIEAQKVVNMQTVFSRHLVARENNGPLIDLGSNRRSGLGIQAYYAKDLDYKPMTAKKYIDAYGPHRYRDERGRLRWPAWRHHDTLYRWPKDEHGNLRPESFFYMWHDGSCPASVVAKIFLDSCQREPVVARQQSVAELLDAWLGPDYLRVGGLEVLHIDEPALEEELWEPQEGAEVEVKQEVPPVQEQVSLNRVEKESTVTVNAVFCYRNWRRVRSRTRRSKWSTSSPQLKSSGRGSRGKGPSSPTGTGGESAKTPTSQTQVWQGSACTARRGSTRTNTRAGPSCARRRWRTIPRPTSVPIRGALTRKRTGRLPVGCFIIAAGSVTTEGTTRTSGAGSGRTRSGPGPRRTSRPTPTRGCSPYREGGMSAGAGGVICVGHRFPTSLPIRRCWTWTSRRWTRSWGFDRGSPGKTAPGPPTSGTPSGAGDITPEALEVRAEREEGSEKRVKRKKREVTAPSEKEKRNLVTRVYREIAFSYVCCDWYLVFIDRAVFYSEYIRILLQGLSQSSLVITRVLLIPVACFKEQFGLSSSRDREYLVFSSLRLVSNSNNRSSCRGSGDQQLRSSSQSVPQSLVISYTEKHFWKRKVVTFGTQLACYSCLKHRRAINKVCTVQPKLGEPGWCMTLLHEQQLNNKQQARRMYCGWRCQTCGRNLGCRSSLGRSSPASGTCRALTRGVWRQDLLVSPNRLDLQVCLRGSTREEERIKEETLLAQLEVRS